jgi:hypothetical protein
MTRVPEQLALRPAWKENLCLLLMAAIAVTASVLFFFAASDFRGPASTIHTHRMAATTAAAAIARSTVASEVVYGESERSLRRLDA